MIPVEGDKKAMTIPTMTTTAIKFGAYVTVWVIFLNGPSLISFKANARMIGSGKPTTNE